MTLKQLIGVAMITIVLLCTLLGLLGAWGVIEGEVAERIFLSLILCAIGLLSVSQMVVWFFPDKSESPKDVK